MSNVMRVVDARRTQMYRATIVAGAKARTISMPVTMPEMTFVRPATARAAFWCVVAFSLLWGALWWEAKPAAAQEFQVFVPMASTGTDGPGGAGEEPAECGLSEEEQVVAQLMESDPGQKRDNPICDPILAQVAQARARDMASRNYFSHTNPDGDGPNLLVREAGYLLPTWYGSNQNSNNVESIGAGYDTPEEAWQAWLGSQGHRTHVLGTNSFYAEQDAYGVGYYYEPNARYKHYWVFISAPIPTE